MTYIAPVAQWPEPPNSGAASSLTRMYFHYDAPSDTWSLTADRSLASGVPMDSTGFADFRMTLTASITPGATQLAVAQRGGDFIAY